MNKKATRDSFGEALAQLALENENVVALSADLAGSARSRAMIKVAPERHFNLGIAEADMIGVAAGLAASGKIPFASSFAMFAAGRAYDQVRNMVGYPHLNVKICASHAGLSAVENGATHQALEDIALMRVIPGMAVIQPCDDRETQQAIKAISEYDGPVYVRLSREPVEEINDESYHFEIGRGMIIHEGSSPIAMFATGCLVQQSLKTLKLLKQQGIDPTLINIHTIKPIDEELIVRYAGKSDFIVSLEEHSIKGGLGSAIAEVTAARCPVRQLFIGTEDVYGESGRHEQLLDKFGLSGEKIAQKILAFRVR
ncbi:MAG: transketolase family protein [Erysipelotrichaceae bacterium]|nr:transketolase family protein [Erysipelotrichaceae bacterium]